MHSRERIGLISFIFVGRQFIQFFHQVRNDAVATKGMILFVDIPHDLPVRNRIVSVLHMAAVALIEAIPEQCDHCKPDGFLFVVPFLQLRELSLVLSSDHALR